MRCCAQRCNAQATALLRVSIERQNDFTLRTAADASGRGEGLLSLLLARPLLAHFSIRKDQADNDSAGNEQAQNGFQRRFQACFKDFDEGSGSFQKDD